MRLPIAAILLGLLLTTPALGWGDKGHRTTAAIAFDAMSPAMQQNVAAVLREHPRYEQDFAALMPADIQGDDEVARGRWLLEQASVWPDLIQGRGDDVRQEYNRSRWHYINLMVFLTPEDAAALEGELDHNMATEFTKPLRQNLNSVQALRGNLLIWQDAAASHAQKAVALCWILHIVGDMHQPLHNVALFSKAYFPTGDRGGNDIEVIAANETKTLHWWWDSLPNEMDDLAPSARTLKTVQNDTIDDAAIEEWLHHHARLAEMFVYPDDVKTQLLDRVTASMTPQVELSHEYLVRARSIARRQINLAGHRIAGLLD
ncbi:MAG: S1/P1 nuclease [Woeseiaceae bacterium]